MCRWRCVTRECVHVHMAPVTFYHSVHHGNRIYRVCYTLIPPHILRCLTVCFSVANPASSRLYFQKLCQVLCPQVIYLPREHTQHHATNDCAHSPPLYSSVSLLCGASTTLYAQGLIGRPHGVEVGRPPLGSRQFDAEHAEEGTSAQSPPSSSCTAAT